jgi:fatty acid desaturase
MNMFTLFVLLAVAATIYSVVCGISSMAVGHDIGHRSSAQWMNLRVVFQGIALILILLALLGTH